MNCKDQTLDFSIFKLDGYFTVVQKIYNTIHSKNIHVYTGVNHQVCVEVLRPNQPNGVMSSAVSLPNHTFTGQA